MAIQPVNFGKEERKGQCLYTVDTDCWGGSSERAELPQILPLTAPGLTLQLTAYLMLITYSEATVCN